MERLARLIQRPVRLTRGRAGRDARPHLRAAAGTLAEEGLVAALAKQAAALGARQGLVIEVDGPEAPLPIGPEVEAQLYRLGQEALANVGKHARASRARVRIAAADAVVSVEVADDGRGFDPAAVGPGSTGARATPPRPRPAGWTMGSER
jgi:signal transduction histidine kinase